MRFLFATLIVFIIIFILSPFLKRFPLPFYIVIVGFDTLYAYGVLQNSTGLFWSQFLPLMQRCTLAFLLFSVVMFTGALKDGSSLKTHLLPLRQQLSIIASILCFCHVVFYLASYLPRITSVLSSNVLFSIALSLFLAFLLVILFVTSFSQIKKRMSADHWKKIQKLAYPFYILTYFHLALLLFPGVLAGKDTAILGFVIYTIIIALYVILRTRRWLLDNKLQEQRHLHQAEA